MNDQKRTELKDLVEVTLAQIKARNAEIIELKEASHTRMLALESLTCGGSEYVGDVNRCVEYIRNGQESMRRGFGKKIELEKARADDVETKNKKLSDERIEAIVQASDAQQRVGQLENELAEYQDKPEAFKRLRELLRKERQMRKQESKRFHEVVDERDAAQAKVTLLKDSLKSEMNHTAQLTGWKNADEVKLAAVHYHLEAWKKNPLSCSGDVKGATLNDIEEAVNIK